MKVHVILTLFNVVEMLLCFQISAERNDGKQTYKFYFTKQRNSGQRSNDFIDVILIFKPEFSLTLLAPSLALM